MDKEQERYYGKVIMAITAIKDLSDSLMFGWSKENLAKWMGSTLEEIKQLEEICYLLSYDGVVRNNLKLLAKERDAGPNSPIIQLCLQKMRKYVLNNYTYPKDVIQYAVEEPFGKSFFFRREIARINRLAEEKDRFIEKRAEELINGEVSFEEMISNLKFNPVYTVFLEYLEVDAEEIIEELKRKRCSR